MNMKILIVDNVKEDILSLTDILDHCEFLTADNDNAAMELLQQHEDIDLILIDLSLPSVSNLKLLGEIRSQAERQDIPVIILTDGKSTQWETRGLAAGATDYIRKPFTYQAVRKRIEQQQKILSAIKFSREQASRLEEEIHTNTMEFSVTRDVLINAIAKLLEIRHIENSNHAVRIRKLMKAFCNHLRTKEKFSQILTPAYSKELYEAAPLHDIGKFGVPDSILLKPSRLTKEEYEIMKLHTSYGVEAIKENMTLVDSFSFLQTAILIISEHHERYDGSGYPRGLKGDGISLPGRLMGIIDVYDALVSTCVYKLPYDHATAMRILLEGSGTQFDPDLIEGFLEISKTVYEITTSGDYI
jgi:putative two-component system response regulator